MILSESVRNAIRFYLYNFLESIQYFWAHEDLCFTTYRQTDTTSRTARKFLTNLMRQKSNCRLVSRVLERKETKRLLTDVPQANVYIHPASVRVKRLILDLGTRNSRGRQLDVIGYQLWLATVTSTGAATGNQYAQRVSFT